MGLSTTSQKQDKYESIMDLIAFRCGYYRHNIHRFAKDYLFLDLKLFQKILLWAMNENDAFYFIAARSAGKTFLTAVYAVCKAILYPKIKIVVASYSYRQGREIVKKISDELMPRSPLLRSEILKVSDGQNDCCVYFKSGSIIRVVVAGESGRGVRSNCLLVDEARLVPQKIVDTILRPMNGTPRQPGFLRKPEYAHLREVNQELFLSSAYYSQSEMFERVKAFTANMLNPDMKYFVCDLNYALMIKEGLLMKESIINEMSESTFSDVAFKMEREGIFYGSAEDALFDFKMLESRRILTDAFYDLDYYRYSNTSPPKKEKGEIRILGVDIALMASRRHSNDASALFIDKLLPTSNNEYMNNFVYIDTKEGIVTEELGIIIMRYFYQYNCDFLVLDGSGIGQALIDYCLSDRYDPIYGCTYEAINCCNNDDIAIRCKSKNAKKAMYVIKANAKSNNDMILALRAGFQNGNINLLINETQAEMTIPKNIKGYTKLQDIQKDRLRLPFIQTTLLINELINLDHEINNGLIKIREKSGMRKDRVSACEYTYAISQELSRDLKPRNTDFQSLINKMIIRRGSYNGVTL